MDETSRNSDENTSNTVVTPHDKVGTEHPANRSQSRNGGTAADYNGPNNIKVVARFRPLLHPQEVGSDNIVSILSEDSVAISTSCIQQQVQPYHQYTHLSSTNVSQLGPMFVQQGQSNLTTQQTASTGFSGQLGPAASENVQQFTFDRVFDADSTQDDVFEYSIRPTVQDVLNGYNGTVLAYGQTGAGKSHTMFGGTGANRGAIPRMIEMIFTHIESSRDPTAYTVQVAYLEIYNEKVKDLLNPANGNGDLRVHETVSGNSSKGGFYVKGLTQIEVHTPSKVLELMARGSKHRATAATNMNYASSRSHSIFSVDVVQKCGLKGRLFLVDLAGSEKAAKTGARGQLLEEAASINKSLSALGMVINNLVNQQKRGSQAVHIPYRDSKLTRILQESLGGSCRATMIINCSSSSINASETLSSLRFGTRAKYVKNTARINLSASNSDAAFLQAVMAELHLWRTGNSPHREDWVDIGEVMARENLANSRPSSRAGVLAASTTHTTLATAQAGPPALDEHDDANAASQISEFKTLIQLLETQLAEEKLNHNKIQEEERARHAQQLLESQTKFRDVVEQHNADVLLRTNSELRKENHRLKKLRKVDKLVLRRREDEIGLLRSQLAVRSELADADHSYARQTYINLEPRVLELISTP